MDEEEVGALRSLWIHGPLLVGFGLIAPFERLEARGYVRCTYCDISTQMPCFEAVPLNVTQALARSEARDDGETAQEG